MTKNNLSIEQQQQLQELGAHLSSIRLAKGLSLDSVAESTRISKRLLEAIETGDLEQLPEPIYIKALVTKFAHNLGVDEIYWEIGSEVNSNGSDRRKSRYQESRLNFQLRSLHLYLMYILLVIVSVKGISNLVERPVVIDQAPEKSPEVTNLPQPSKTAIPVQSTPSEATSTPQFVSQASNSEAVSVGINLQEKCWLKVMVDGKIAFEGILPEGTQRQWTGEKEVTIRAGNAGGVVISFNNQQQQILGAPGEVEEITYTVN